MRNLLIGLLWLLTSAASATPPNKPVVAEHAVNAQIGKFRFELNNLGATPFKLWDTTPGEIVVFRSDGEILQKLSVEVEIDEPYFDFIDLKKVIHKNWRLFEQHFRNAK